MKKTFENLGIAAMIAIIPYLVIAPKDCTGINESQCNYHGFSLGLYLICVAVIWAMLAIGSYRENKS